MLRFFVKVGLVLAFMFWVASELDQRDRTPINWECVERARNHDYCNRIGGAMDACKSIIKQECFPHNWE